MFAQIIIHSPSRIDPKVFLRDLPRNGTRLEAIKNSSFHDNPTPAAAVIAWSYSVSAVSLFFPKGTNGIEVQVESHLDNGRIEKLKEEVKNVVTILFDLAGGNHIILDDVYISIFAEDNLIQRGYWISFSDYFKKGFKENILSSFLLALSVALVNLFLSSNTKIAGWTFIATILALMARMLYDVFTYKGGIHYVDS